MPKVIDSKGNAVRGSKVKPSKADKGRKASDKGNPRKPKPKPAKLGNRGVPTEGTLSEWAEGVKLNRKPDSKRVVVTPAGNGAIRANIDGFTVVNFVRWAGYHGADKSAVAAALATLGVPSRENMVNAQLNDGRRQREGKPQTYGTVPGVKGATAPDKATVAKWRSLLKLGK